jgi:hypothetical protein
VNVTAGLNTSIDAGPDEVPATHDAVVSQGGQYLIGLIGIGFTDRSNDSLWSVWRSVSHMSSFVCCFVRFHSTPK